MATVESNNRITIMKYNNFTDDAIDISIRDIQGDEVLLLDEDVRFLHETIDKWINERR